MIKNRVGLVAILFLGVFLLAGWLGANWWFKYGRVKEVQTTKMGAEFEEEELSPVEPRKVKNITEGIGPNWKEGFVEASDLNKEDIFFRGVSDGKIIIDPVELKTKEGELLATMVAGSRVYYLDTDGKLQSVIRALKLQLKNGKFLNLRDLDRYNTEWLKIGCGLGSDVAGEVVITSVTTDPELWWKTWVKLYPDIIESGSQRIYNGVMKKYYASYNKEMQGFLQTGDPDIKIVLPAVFNCGEVIIVEDLSDISK